MATKEDYLRALGSYNLLCRALEQQPSLEDFDEEAQALAITEAAKDFAKHNSLIKLVPRAHDHIKCISFVGCHLLGWIEQSEESQRCVVRALVLTLCSIVETERPDGKTLDQNTLKHIERLVLLEALTARDTAPTSDIWGHGFWRVGLYVSFLTCARLA